jgi:hypothetical protein
VNVGVLVVLACLASPIVLVVAHILRDVQHNRRIQRSPSSVASIRRRVARERAETEAANAPTDVLPVIHPAPATEPTEVMLPVHPPRPRPYVGRTEAPPRRPPNQPAPQVMARVLRGLRRLPTQPAEAPTSPWPNADPDSNHRPT